MVRLYHDSSCCKATGCNTAVTRELALTIYINSGIHPSNLPEGGKQNNLFAEILLQNYKNRHSIKILKNDL